MQSCNRDYKCKSHMLFFKMSLRTKLVTLSLQMQMLHAVVCFLKCLLRTELVREITIKHSSHSYCFFKNVFKNSTCNGDYKCKSHMLLFLLNVFKNSTCNRDCKCKSHMLLFVFQMSLRTEPVIETTDANLTWYRPF